jgi:hypothetical protein
MFEFWPCETCAYNWRWIYCEIWSRRGGVLDCVLRPVGELMAVLFRR